MKFDEYPYDLSIQINKDGKKIYLATFKDACGTEQKHEVELPIFICLLQEKRILRNLCRFDERHTEQSEVSEETLCKRIMNPQKSVDESIISDELSFKLNDAIAGLPETQRKRFILYYEFGLTYEQIAELNGCSARAIKYSTDIAREKIIKKIKN